MATETTLDKQVDDTARYAGVPVSSLAVGLALFWSLAVLASLVWNVHQVRELVLEQASIELRANFFKDLTFRRWASEHGGVYVPVTERTRPDPYIDYIPERDVRTPSGRLLTLINPALMVRQFNELAQESYGARGHLSGLDPINPINRPDPWEAQALTRLQQGEEEITGIAEIDGAPYLRLIRPMIMADNCLACHQQQGYRKGDLAGGISVSVPLAPLQQAADRRTHALAAAHGLLWLLGLSGIGLGTRQLARRARESHAAYRELREHEERTGAILGASLDGIIAIDADDRIIDWNPQAEGIFGWTREEVLGRSLSDTIVPPAHRAAHQAGLRNHLQNGTGRLLNRRVELTALRRDGGEFPIELSIARISHGGAAQFSAYVRDISERRDSEQKIHRDYHTQRVLAELLETSMRPEHFVKRLQQSLELILSTPWLSLKGTGCIFLADEVTGELRMVASHGLPAEILNSCATVQPGSCLCGKSAAERRLVFSECIDEQHTHRYPGITAHGHYCAPILMDDRLLGVLNIYLDEHHESTPEETRFISSVAYTLAGMIQRHRAEEQLRHHAYHDSLTNLPNRTRFMDRLEHCIHYCKRHPGTRCAVLYLDLDRFKTINDSLGHGFGDRLLLEISDRIRDCMRPEDTVARMGGDEFTLLLEEVQDPADALRVADRLHQVLREPFRIEEREVFIAASIGIALSSTDARVATDLLRDADTAMYRAKSRGTGHTVLFDEGMHLHAVSQLNLETELRQALERGELRLHYQPIVAAHSGQVLGFEALVRWEHPVRGLVPPGEFIPVAEETGLINRIGHWVLLEACRQLQEWRQACPDQGGLYMSINLSARQFLQPDLLERIDAVMADTGVPAHCLALEITESVLVDNRESTHRTLLDLKARGLHLYIDDFGTGYSSLSYLHHFPFDALKIDRAFVSRLSADAKEVEMVSTIIAIARNFNMGVIAEGVETDTQLERLIALGCKRVQGFYFAPALPAAEAATWLQQPVADNTPA